MSEKPILKEHRTCNGEGWHWSPNEGREVPCDGCGASGIDPQSEWELDQWRKLNRSEKEAE